MKYCVQFDVLEGDDRPGSESSFKERAIHRRESSENAFLLHLWVVLDDYCCPCTANTTCRFEQLPYSDRTRWELGRTIIFYHDVR